MFEGFWVRDEVREHREYLEAVPHVLSVEDPETGQTWEGPVSRITGDTIYFMPEDRDDCLRLKTLPSKEANRLYVDGATVIGTKYRLNLQPAAEVDDV